MHILKQIMPGASEENINKYYPIFEKYKDQYGINTPLREAMFWAQVAVESNQLKKVQENLLYRTPERLMAVWPKRFRTKAVALGYIGKPEKLGNYVYGNRMGNDATNGYRNRGRGLIQCTGKNNILQYSMDTYGDDRIYQNPDLLLLPEDAVLSALWFWKKNNLNSIADTGSVLAATRKINGGTEGLADRQWFYTQATKAFKI